MKIWIPTQKEAAKLLSSSGDAKGGTGGSGGSGAGTVNVGGLYGDSAGIEAAGTRTADVDAAAAGASAGGSETAMSDSGLVNINTATVEQLCTLNGIGESRAKTIIAYREEHGAFAKKEDIMKVTGIKENSYAKIRDQITVGKE